MLTCVNKLIIDGKAVYNDKQIANALNEYFSSVGNTLSKQISNKNRSYKDYLKNPLPRSIYLTPTDEKEICTEIDKLKPKKSTLDIFNINMLKYVKDEMILGLVIIFNKSISEGIFPELLKTAKVIPIYKKDDTNFAKNYRPISLLSVFDKIIEKLVYKRVHSFLSKHNVLYKYQYGFRTNFSTTHALLDVLNYIYTALDEGKYVFGIYIDLKKAFDTVNHNILLTKLEYYGIRGLALKWFTSYLNNRSQFVSTNGVTSNIKRLGNYGVPQGSVLGPLLFLLFINDIHTSLKHSNIKLFADDTNCFFSGNNFHSLQDTVITEVCSLQNWVNANELTINFDPDKSCYTIFKPTNKKLPDSYKDGLILHNNVLQYREHTTYLGIILDDKLYGKSK